MWHKSWLFVNMHYISSYENLSAHVQCLRIGDFGSGSRHDGYPNSSLIKKSANKVCRSNKPALWNVLYPNSTTRMLLKVETYELSGFQTSWQRDVSQPHEHPHIESPTALFCAGSWPTLVPAAFLAEFICFRVPAVWPLALSSPCIRLDSVCACVRVCETLLGPDNFVELSCL